MTAYGAIGAALVIMAFVIPVGLWFGVGLPGQVAYNRAFGGQISITIDQPTTSGMSHGLMKIWQKMNQTWPDNHDSIYGSGWWWEQTPDNSLASEDRYFSSEIQRLNNYSAAYDEYKAAGVKTVTGLPLIDWYTQIVNNSRHELQRNGGLDWAIQGAWLLQYSPITYWFGLYAMAIFTPLIAIAIVLIAKELS